MADSQNNNVSVDGNRDLPPGDSAVEIAARRGFGPLSPLVSDAWHGDSRPCVSCGQLVRRASAACDACGEDLSDQMVQKMRAFAGPWYVLEHVRPFPGVTYERLIRQIRRGVLTRSTIVKGPSTDHQWRYACETPGLSKHLGFCWNCQGQATPDRGHCESCGVDLGELNDASGSATAPIPRNTAPRTTHESAELKVLADATRTGSRADVLFDESPRIGAIKVSWIVAVILILVMTILYAVVQLRAGHPSPERERRVNSHPTPAHVRTSSE